MTTSSGVGDFSTPVASLSSDTFAISRIGSTPAEEFDQPTFAAGAVLWRHVSTVTAPGADSAPDSAGGVEENIEIAMIHRPRYNDWSLPKGKVDKGESLAATAIREITEETGYHSTLGWLLGYVSYPVGTSTKVVWYWTAEVTDYSDAIPQDTDEVEAVQWVSPTAAATLCTYEADRAVISAACERLSRGATRRVLYVRHAKAADRRGWQGDDILRPLTRKGRRQSEALVPIAQAYGVKQVSSARPERCIDTVFPMAHALGLDVTVDRDLGDIGLDAGPRAVMEALVRASAAPVSAICAQGEVIPAVIAGLAAETGALIDDLRVKKSSVWILHFSDTGELLGADYLASPLPIK